MELRIAYLIPLLLINVISTADIKLSEQEYFKRIKDLADKGEKKELVETANRFFKQYPMSGLIADIKFILADNETEPGAAVYQFQIIIDKYKFFLHRDYAQYKICEILYLQSKWKELENESRKAIGLFEKSEFLIQYKFLLAKAYIHQDEFEKAKKVCLEIIENNHDYNTLSDNLLLLSYINKNLFGQSGSYLYSLKEIITGFNESAGMPAALLLMGRYYEYKKDYDKAFSAYSDLVRDFPKSPEAVYSREQLEQIAQYKPVKTNYIPEEKNIRKTDQIDIQPEIELDDKNNETQIQYSISLGPFSNISDAREIKELIIKDFQPVEIAEIKDEYRIYTGRFSDISSALITKTRLAEEFGINGNIVKIIRDEKKMYIYEE